MQPERKFKSELKDEERTYVKNPTEFLDGQSKRRLRRKQNKK